MNYHFDLDLSARAIALLFDLLDRHGALKDPEIGTPAHELQNFKNELRANMQHIVEEKRAAAANNSDLL